MRPRLSTARSTAGAVAALLLTASACSDPNNEASAADDGAAAGDDEPSDDEVDVFDATIVHSIAVEFDPAEYQTMIDVYTETGEKESIEARVTIDGVTYEQVGLRLKGNSSLAGLDGGRSGGGIGPAGSASADDPESLPWLIELDEFVDQSHDGYEDIVIRSNNSETSLNEAVALDLLEEAGLASQEAMATSFSVNGSDPVLRLAIEHPDDDAWYERAFDDAAGALYKAESTGDWSYRGDDPEAYDEVFDQEGGDDVADLTPLMEFLQFIDESDDETFAEELPERLDVEAFATYLAMMDLIGNSDDIDGPGNNSYLWWDAETEQFTVVPWDMNLAFGGFGGGPGGQRAGGFDPEQMPGGGELPEDFDPGQLPGGGELPEGFDPEQLPGGGEAPDGFPAGPGGGRGGGIGGRSNPLVERFHTTAEFEALYEEQLVELEAALVDSGVADEVLDEWAATLSAGAGDLVDEATISDEAAAIRTQLG